MISQESTNLVEDVDMFLPVKFPCIPFSGKNKSIMYWPIRGQGGHLDFVNGQKSTNFRV